MKIKKYINVVNKPISVYKIEVRWMAGDGDFYRHEVYSAFHDDKFLAIMDFLKAKRWGSDALTHDQRVEAEAVLGGWQEDDYGIAMSVDKVTPYWYDSQGTRHGVTLEEDDA